VTDGELAAHAPWQKLGHPASTVAQEILEEDRPASVAIAPFARREQGSKETAASKSSKAKVSTNLDGPEVVAHCAQSERSDSY
jgi:hypothetical protein